MTDHPHKSGIYVGTEGTQPVMVDAPYTGVDVCVEPFPDTVGASFGSDIYVGATWPSALPPST